MGGEGGLCTEEERNENETSRHQKSYNQINYRFMHGIEPQFLALQKGFNELIPQCLLKCFDERELELVIGGLGTIDLEDWRTNTRLKHCQTETSQVERSDYIMKLREQWAWFTQKRLVQIIRPCRRPKSFFTYFTYFYFQDINMHFWEKNGNAKLQLPGWLLFMKCLS